MWCLSLYFEQKSAWSEMNFAPLICHTCRVMVGCIPHGHGLHGDTRWCLREYQQKTTQISPEMSFQYFPIASLWILQRWPNLVDAIHVFLFFESLLFMGWDYHLMSSPYHHWNHHRYVPHPMPGPYRIDDGGALALAVPDETLWDARRFRRCQGCFPNTWEVRCWKEMKGYIIYII